jgi:hypothetical protein
MSGQVVVRRRAVSQPTTCCNQSRTLPAQCYGGARLGSWQTQGKATDDMSGLFNTALRFGAASAGANVANQVVARGMAPTKSAPAWTNTVGETVVTLMRHTKYGRADWYVLHVIENGSSRAVGSYPSYPEALAGIQTWVVYLEGGGTLLNWLQNQQQQAVEPRGRRG